MNATLAENATKTLADHEIEALIKRGELVLDAVPEGCVGACYELRLGNFYYDLTESDQPINIPADGTVLIKPGHRVVLITHERLNLDASTFARIISKGSLFSVGLSPVATYADPGFRGRIGVVTQNISDKYIVLPLFEKIAKIDFTMLETPAKRTYQGQHGYETKIWPIKHQFQKTREQLAGDPRLASVPKEIEKTPSGGGATLSDLVRRQIAADRKRGFPTDPPDEKSRSEQISKDLVGLLGEMGEFANLLKKIDLTITRPGYKGPDLSTSKPELRAELADAQIYLLRLAHLVGIDLSEAVLDKMQSNDERYAYLEST